MMHALNDLASHVTAGTMKTEETQECFLNYCVTNPDTTIKYQASDMIIRVDSDETYLVASKARSRTASFIYMGNKDRNKEIINALIKVISKISKMVGASAAETEVSALYHNAKGIVSLQIQQQNLDILNHQHR